MSKLNGMQIFELLSNVSDNLIVESVSPALLVGGATGVAAGAAVGAGETAGTATATAKVGFGAWLAKGGWLAILAGVLVAAGVAVGVTFAGRDTGRTPPVGSDEVTVAGEEGSRDEGTGVEVPTETESETETETESESESETESETQPDPENCIHSFSGWVFTVMPTCTEGGVRSRVCPLCGTIEDDEIPAGMHTFDSYGYCEVCHVGCSDLSFTSNGDGTCSVGRGDIAHGANTLEIPNYSPDGDLVVAIEPEAFTEMPRLNSVTFPERLYSIGDKAFMSCSNLAEVDFPDRLAVIGEQAFYGCALTQVSFPASLYKLGAGAFSNTALTEVFLPATITELGGAFSLCKELTSLTFEEGFVLEAVPTGLASFCTSLKEITLPPTVTSIERYAFGYSGLVTVHGITDGLTSIGEIAFCDCKDLANFTIPASVTSIGINAFQNCESLSYTSYEGGLYLAVGDNPLALFMKPEDSQLTEITLPPQTVFIEGNAFRDCTRLRSIVIPEGVTVLHYGVFKGCTSLESVTLPSTLTQIGAALFKGCSRLETVTIPDGVAAIGEGAFMDCISLTSVKLPASLTAIEKETFSGCLALTAIDVPAGVRTIGENAFYQCRAMTSVTLHDGLETIGDFAFYLSGITALDMPDSVTSLGAGALAGTALQSLRLSSGLTIIEESAVDSCRLLTEIIIPEGVEKLSRDSIRYCSALKRMSLPRSLKTLMRSALFYSTCEEIDYAGTLEEWNAVVKQDRWYGTSTNLVIHCTDGDTTVTE